MKKKIYILCTFLIGLSISLRNYAQVQFVVNVPVTMTWDFAEGVAGQTAVYSDTTAKHFEQDEVTVGSNLSYTTAKNWRDATNGGVVLDVFTAFTPTASHSAGNPEDCVNFNIYPNTNLAFTPELIEFDCGRYGTDGGKVDLAWVSPDGTETMLATGIIPARDNHTDYPTYTHTSIDMTTISVPVDEGDCAVRIYIYSLNPGKEVGLGNIIVKGMVSDASGLTAHWKFDEGSGTLAADELAVSNGTLFNMTDPWIDGFIGKAIDYSSAAVSSDTMKYFHADGAATDFGTNSFSLSVIAKMNDPFGTTNTQEQAIVGHGLPYTDLREDGSSAGSYLLSYKAGEIKFMLFDGVNTATVKVPVPEDHPVGDWVHLMCVRDNLNGTIKLYFNGKLLDEIEDNIGDISGGKEIFIGASPNPIFPSPPYMDGAVDEVKVMNKALSSAKVREIYYDYGFADVGLVSQWKLDEGSGSVVTDSLTMATGEIVGGGVDWINGVDGMALDFSAAVDTAVIIAEDTPALSAINLSGSLTLSLLAKIDPDSAQQELFIKGSNNHEDGGAGANGNRYEMYAKDGEVYFVIDDDVTKTQLPLDVFRYPTDEWAHLVGVRNRDTDSLYIYINGILKGQVVDGSGDIDVSGVPMLIGNYHNKENKVRGAMDDVRIYDRALTPAEILALAEHYGMEPVYIPSSDCSLSYLRPSEGTLDPAFNAGTDFYTIEVPTGITEVKFTARTTHAEAAAGGDLTFDITDVSAGSYRNAVITVTAEDGSTCDYTIRVFKLTGVEQSRLDHIRIYPNPAQDMLYITSAQDASVSLYNLNGALVKSMVSVSDELSVDMSALNTGVYILKVQVAEGVKVERIIKE